MCKRLFDLHSQSEEKSDSDDTIGLELGEVAMIPCTMESVDVKRVGAILRVHFDRSYL